MSNNVKARSYTLIDKNNKWVAQVVITSDGMFSAISDYGNFSFAWRNFSQNDFRKFLLSLDEGYFGGKMYQGMSYIVSTKKVEDRCYIFANNILILLKEVLNNDIEKNSVF